MAPTGSRSTRRTASIARPATSRTRPRTSSGSRHREAAGRTTQTCSLTRLYPLKIKGIVVSNERSYYSPRMRKGEQTRTLILNEAVALASEVGLEGLSIGSLAGRVETSKSRLFAHFRCTAEHK